MLRVLCCDNIELLDEVLIESSEDDADKVGSIMSEAYTLAAYEMWQWHKNNSKWFKGLDLPSFCIDLSSGYKLGKTYFDVH